MINFAETGALHGASNLCQRGPTALAATGRGQLPSIHGNQVSKCFSKLIQKFPSKKGPKEERGSLQEHWTSPGQLPLAVQTNNRGFLPVFALGVGRVRAGEQLVQERTISGQFNTILLLLLHSARAGKGQRGPCP